MNLLRGWKKNLGVALSALFLVVLSGCSVAQLTSLRAFSQPWIGVYECTEAYYGEENVFSYVREILLTLEADDRFTVQIMPRLGTTIRGAGNYEYSEETGTITFWISSGGQTRRCSTVMQDGEFLLSHSFGEKTMRLRFVCKS